MSQFWLIKDRRQITERIAFFQQWLESEWDFSQPVTWEPKIYRNKRSLTQNALFHVWCRELSAHFSANGYEVSEKEMKDLMKHKFLGCEDRVIHNTVIPQQLRESSELDSGEMMVFLDQIWAWAADHGVTLQIPADSEYMKLKGESHE